MQVASEPCEEHDATPIAETSVQEKENNDYNFVAQKVPLLAYDRAIN